MKSAKNAKQPEKLKTNDWKEKAVQLASGQKFDKLYENFRKWPLKYMVELVYDPPHILHKTLELFMRKHQVRDDSILCEQVNIFLFIVNTIHLLKEYPAKTNILTLQDKIGSTILNWAIAIESDSLVKILLEYGAPINSHTIAPFEAALARGNLLVFDMILKRGATCHYMIENFGTQDHAPYISLATHKRKTLHKRVEEVYKQLSNVCTNYQKQFYTYFVEKSKGPIICFACQNRAFGPIQNAQFSWPVNKDDHVVIVMSLVVWDTQKNIFVVSNYPPLLDRPPIMRTKDADVATADWGQVNANLPGKIWLLDRNRESLEQLTIELSLGPENVFSSFFIACQFLKVTWVQNNNL